jgi:DNA-binding protein H-NS
MAKQARSFDHRHVKDWFSGLAFEVQQTVLDDFRSTFEASKEQRISKLEKELAALRGGKGSARSVSAPAGGRAASRGKAAAKKGMKVPPKYRDAEGNTWAGRGVYPRWITEYLKKRGTKLEDLLIRK